MITIIIIIKNTQNKQYTIQFFSPHNDQLRSQSPSSNHGLCGTPGFCQIHGKRLNSRKTVPAPQPTPTYELSMMSTAWNTSTGQLGLAAWLCSLPALTHLLISQTREMEKRPRFLSNN